MRPFSATSGPTARPDRVCPATRSAAAQRPCVLLQPLHAEQLGEDRFFQLGLGANPSASASGRVSEGLVRCHGPISPGAWPTGSPAPSPGKRVDDSGRSTTERSSTPAGRGCGRNPSRAARVRRSCPTIKPAWEQPLGRCIDPVALLRRRSPPACGRGMHAVVAERASVGNPDRRRSPGPVTRAGPRRTHLSGRRSRRIPPAPIGRWPGPCWS